MSMSRWFGRFLIGALVVLGAACQQSHPNAVYSDPDSVAAIDTILDKAVAAAGAANAEGVLASTTTDGTFTFITGDTMLTGYDEALADFKKTYALLRGQTNQIIEKRIRFLTPDVVLVSAVSEGTYTDKAGFTSPLVGLGSTAVFVRRGGAWRLIHYHQSVAK